eukprot:TRINITY_DN2953_c0_g1_i15.p1 TRINITY_DN2953_c0_g1~~TRINITY_DN2953_c0_g1_i15.p1  ORF type:complete len:251 (-),score=55.17 TRINITY_DN2953_c0_g1_i15:163-915(-)
MLEVKSSVAKSIWARLSNSFDISTTNTRSRAAISTYKTNQFTKAKLPSRFHKKPPQRRDRIDFAALRRLFENQHKVSRIIEKQLKIARLNDSLYRSKVSREVQARREQWLKVPHAKYKNKLTSPDTIDTHSTQFSIVARKYSQISQSSNASNASYKLKHIFTKNQDAHKRRSIPLGDLPSINKSLNAETKPYLVENYRRAIIIISNDRRISSLLHKISRTPHKPLCHPMSTIGNWKSNGASSFIIRTHKE